MRVRQASVAVILITVFIDMVGIGIVFPIMPKLIQSDAWRRRGRRVYLLRRCWSALYYLMNFLASPVLGGLSDRNRADGR